MAPPGLTALGAKGSACERLRLTGRLRAPPRVVMKYRCAGEVWRPSLKDKPQRGLRVLKFDGAIAPRVLKFDSGSAAEGCCGRLTFIEGALLR